VHEPLHWASTGLSLPKFEVLLAHVLLPVKHLLFNLLLNTRPNPRSCVGITAALQDTLCAQCCVHLSAVNDVLAAIVQAKVLDQVRHVTQA
jgi:hypothetical protein